jgi:uncharacterized RDD family membrane protein YckC
MPAPLWRQAVAVLIDAAVYSPVILLQGHLVTPAPRRRVTPQGSTLELGEQSALQRTVMVASEGAVATVRLAGRNYLTPGKRAMRLRQIDARTCGPLTVRQALTRQVAEKLLSAALTEALRPYTADNLEKFENQQLRLREIQNAHRDDKLRQQQEILFSEENKIHVAMLLPVMLRLLVMTATALFSPRRQNLISRVAGIAVVYEPPGTAEGRLARDTRPMRLPTNATVAIQKRRRALSGS